MKKIILFLLVNTLQALCVKDRARIYSADSALEFIFHTSDTLNSQDEMVIILREGKCSNKLFASFKKNGTMWSQAALICDTQNSINDCIPERIDEYNLVVYWTEANKQSLKINGAKCDQKGLWTALKGTWKIFGDSKVLDIFVNAAGQPGYLCNCKYFKDDIRFLKQGTFLSEDYSASLFLTDTLLSDGPINRDQFHLNLTKEGDGSYIYISDNKEVIEKKILNFNPISTIVINDHCDSVEDLEVFKCYNQPFAISFISDEKYFNIFQKIENEWFKFLEIPITNCNYPSLKLGLLSNGFLAACIVEEVKKEVYLKTFLNDGKNYGAPEFFKPTSDYDVFLAYLSSGLVLFWIEDENIYFSEFDEVNKMWSHRRRLDIDYHHIMSIEISQKNQEKILMTILSNDKMNTTHLDILEITP